MMASKHFRALALSVAAGAGLYLVAALWTGAAQVGAGLVQMGVGMVLAALGFSLVNYGLRFLRWQLYLRALGHPLPTLASARIWLAGFALTTTPGKAGEAVRSLMLKPLGVPYTASLAAFVAERLSDLVAIVALAMFGLARFPQWWPLVVAGIGLVLGGLAVLAHRGWLEAAGAWCRGRPGGAAKLAAQILGLLLAARVCYQPRLLLWTTALSLLAWAAEAWALHLMLARLGLDAGVLAAFFVYAASMLAGALSFLPGGLGGTEATMVGLLLALGLDQAKAVAATVLIRLATLWFAVALGVVALASLGSGRDVKEAV